jgi:hypothetical protein
MNKNIIENNEYYKKKYIKYKLKYLELKKINDIQGGMGWSSVFSSAYNYTKSNPNSISKISNITSNIGSNINNFSSKIYNFGITGFKKYLSLSPQYQILVKNGFITPENEKIIFELLQLEISHLVDPFFYPIMLNLIKNILILAGSVETFNPGLVLSALTELYNILNQMKSRYPKDFILLSTFLRNNKDKIFRTINKNGITFPGMETQFNLFMKLIEINY